MQDKTFFCNLAALFWRYYILEPTKENFEEMLSYFSDELVMIGTGKHEFYTSIDKIFESMGENQVEAESVVFEVLDEWYDCLAISRDIFLVYGGIWVRQQGAPGDEMRIEMDTRFSLLFRRKGERCELVHIHHSTPYAEQQQGEYYPKTLSEQAKAAMDLAEEFKRQSELDLMTECYNNVSFKRHVIERMEACGHGNLYLFDLDYFKSVNDTCGHAAGDTMLRVFADLLKQTFDEKAIVGRMGGDEFAVFECTPLPKEQTIEKITQMQEAFQGAAHAMLVHDMAGFSAGIVSMTNGTDRFEGIYANADRALYHAKQLGRRTHYWHCD